jgi:hypothetical protein
MAEFYSATTRLSDRFRGPLLLQDLHDLDQTQGKAKKLNSLEVVFLEVVFFVYYPSKSSSVFGSLKTQGDDHAVILFKGPIYPGSDARDDEVRCKS